VREENGNSRPVWVQACQDIGRRASQSRINRQSQLGVAEVSARNRHTQRERDSPSTDLHPVRRSSAQRAADCCKSLAPGSARNMDTRGPRCSTAAAGSFSSWCCWRPCSGCAAVYVCGGLRRCPCARAPRFPCAPVAATPLDRATHDLKPRPAACHARCDARSPKQRTASAFFVRCSSACGFCSAACTEASEPLPRPGLRGALAP
jgi:hypothetical protein